MATPVVSQAMNLFEIVAQIACNLSLARLYLARGINNTWFAVAAHRVRAAFDQRRLVSLFFSRTEDFLWLMARHDVILCGLPVLDMFDEVRTYDQVPCLEAIVEAANAYDVERFLLDDGYTRISSAPRHQANARFTMPDPISVTIHTLVSISHYIRHVSIFVRDVPSPGLARAVCVVWSSHSPAVTVTNMDHSLQMTFMTRRRVFCLFPNETLLRRRSLQLRGGPRDTVSFSEYHARGYELAFWFEGPNDGNSMSCLYRHIGDHSTWSLELLGGEEDHASSGYLWDLNAFKVVTYRSSGPQPLAAASTLLYLTRVYSCPLVHPGLAARSYSACFEFRRQWYDRMLELFPDSEYRATSYLYREAVVTNILVAMRSLFAAELRSPTELHGAVALDPRAECEWVLDSVDMVD